jgi:hypothetical protein
MSQELKSNERYGLGKAIGDKACHLFAKWAVSRFSGPSAVSAHGPTVASNSTDSASSRLIAAE